MRQASPQRVPVASRSSIDDSGALAEFAAHGLAWNALQLLLDRFIKDLHDQAARARDDHEFRLGKLVGAEETRAFVLDTIRAEFKKGF